ncbi:MAG: cytochrome b N-terminal domain-containing protein [Bacteroidales bacterium]|jgi:hypothetical protein|nr:cytochrome b N-terminal domain-containing protein [Bacteroidales bacterium]
MIRFFDIVQKYLNDTVGGLALSSLMICILSGIFLSLPYDAASPFNSLSLIMIDNPAAVYFRNVHYWSAQLFLVLTLLHITEHLLRKSEKLVARAVWWRLTLSVPVIFFVMISGFILKGDADSVSAFRVLSALFREIPWVGSLLSFSITGNEPSFKTLYMHHIATATIIIVAVIAEHYRKFWPPAGSFLLLTFFILIISYFLHPFFGVETGKGPWYFVGLQEFLRYFSRPALIWVLVAVFLTGLGIVSATGPVQNRRIKRGIAVFFLFYGLLTVTGLFFRDFDQSLRFPWNIHDKGWMGVAIWPLELSAPEDHDFSGPVPLVNGHYEGCLVCHDNVKGLSVAHDPAAIGCSSCHGGNPATLDKFLAHRNMILVPGQLADARGSCGTALCHPGIPDRIDRSLMTTMSGVISVNRYVFGEEATPDIRAHVKDVGNSAADRHLRDLCVNCHLGNLKTSPGPNNSISRGGGCNACHLHYSDSALASLANYNQSATIEDSALFYHPQLNLKIPDDNCFSCHSRSGRIALSYAGWHETLYNDDDIPDTGNFKVLDDRRVVRYVGQDVHHKAGMTCIDCHISRELMGDGESYRHKEEQVKIGCSDCHFTDNPLTVYAKDADPESVKILKLRNRINDSLRLLKTATGGYPIINSRVSEDGRAWLALKSGDSLLALRPPAAACTRGKAHRSLSCGSCHSSWVPQCIGCHNAFDPKATGYDMLENRERSGSWVEYAGLFLTGEPALGIIEAERGNRTVTTFTPGMVISIDAESYYRDQDGGPIFRRLYAPVSAHTTVRQGRTCRSCHLDPLAIGYGRGELIYSMNSDRGTWDFVNRFERSSYDNLPEDAWIGFLEEPDAFASTRSNARPFNLEEQKSILTAGACLECHEENSAVMQAALDNFDSVLIKVSKRCVLPVWPAAN